MKRFDVCVPKKYTQNNEEKTAWNNVGTLVHFPATAEKKEGYVLELSMWPDVSFKVFEQKPRDAKPVKTEEEIVADGSDEGIDESQIPF